MNFEDDDFVHDDEHAPNASPKTGQKLRAVPPPAANDDSTLRPILVSDVLQQWRSSGPLRHEPTGIRTLDEKTGGGPVYGTRWYLAGAPDAGKTAILIQIAHDMAKAGVTVGLLAVDEEAGDLVTRLAQRIGFARLACEIREDHDLDDMGKTLSPLPLRLYDEQWTIEAAAENLAEYARKRFEEDPMAHPHGPRAFLGIDSLQTVSCGLEHAMVSAGKEMSDAGAVTSRVRAIRKAATKHNLIAFVTSEMGRSSYSNPDKATPTMAGAKWSGAVEYSARVLLGLRNVPNEKDTLDLEIAKNKHGPREEHIFLQIDRRSQIVSESGYMPFPEDDESFEQQRTDAREKRTREQARKDAGQIAVILARRPGLGVRDLRGASRAQLGTSSHDRIDAAMDVLGRSLLKLPAPKNGLSLQLIGTLVPNEVIETLEDGDKHLVRESRPVNQ